MLTKQYNKAWESHLPLCKWSPDLQCLTVAFYRLMCSMALKIFLFDRCECTHVFICGWLLPGRCKLDHPWRQNDLRPEGTPTEKYERRNGFVTEVGAYSAQSAHLHVVAFDFDVHLLSNLLPTFECVLGDFKAAVYDRLTS